MPKLVSTYKISSHQAAVLRESPYGMPRGRVTRVLGSKSNWVLWHGHDLPKAIPVAKAFCAVAAEFELSAAVTAGTVRQIFDEHEQMQPEDMNALKGILGPIPYAAHGIAAFATREVKAYPKSNLRKRTTK